MGKAKKEDRGLAERLTGLDEWGIREYKRPPAGSKNDVSYPTGSKPRQNIRIWARMLVGREDLNEERERLRKNVPPALRP